MISSYPTVQLKPYLKQISKRNKSDSSIEVFSVTNSDGFTKSTDYFSKKVFSKNLSNYKIVLRDQFAYNPSRINVGSIDYLRVSDRALVSPLYIVFETNKEIIPDYLLRYLKSDWGNQQIRSNTEGAVRDSLKYKGLENIKVPIPNLNDQIRIAHLLGKVEALIAQRKQHLQELDELLKSVFLEMFGDPVRNEKGWPKKKIGDLVREVKYGTSSPAKGGQYKYLRMNNITTEGHWDFDNLKYIEVDDKDFEKYVLKKGDIVFNRTNSKELVGKTAVYQSSEPVIIAGYLIRVRVNDQNNPWFIWGHLNSIYGKTRLSKICRNIVGMANINAKELQAIPILHPSLYLQNKFESIVEKSNELKARYLQSVTSLENLYGALSQKAFKGELDLSAIPLPDEPEPQESNESLADIKAAFSKLDDNPMADAESRIALLQQWFGEFLLIENETLESFWKKAQFKALDYDASDEESDGSPQYFSIEDYDRLKDWVFEQIRNKKITQKLNSAEEFANQIHLKNA